jgi:hypothetical protein
MHAAHSLFFRREAACVALAAASFAECLAVNITPVIETIARHLAEAAEAAAIAAEAAREAAFDTMIYDTGVVNRVIRLAKKRRKELEIERKKNAVEKSAIERLKNTVTAHSRNKKFVSNAFRALDKWEEVQSQLDRILVNCKLVTVNVLKKQVRSSILYGHTVFSICSYSVQYPSTRVL